MATKMIRVVVFTYAFIAINLSAAYGSDEDFLHSPAQKNSGSAHRVAQPNMRRCISLSAEMAHEADIGGDDAHGRSHHQSIYSPVHTPAHLELRKDRGANPEPSGSRNPSGLQLSSSGVSQPHHEHGEEYTQLQTQLFPLIRF